MNMILLVVFILAISSCAYVTNGIVIAYPPMATKVRLNHTAFFYCHAVDYDGYNITYTWQFNGHPIDFHLNPEYISGQRRRAGGLYITHAQSNNSGVYECVAETTVDSASAAATLTVRDISDSAAVQEALNSGDRTDQRSVTLEHLLPYTAYRFRVRAINRLGRGGASQPSDIIHTPEMLPVVAP